jgi:hypothetical protein
LASVLTVNSIKLISTVAKAPTIPAKKPFRKPSTTDINPNNMIAGISGPISKLAKGEINETVPKL